MMTQDASHKTAEAYYKICFKHTIASWAWLDFTIAIRIWTRGQIFGSCFCVGEIALGSKYEPTCLLKHTNNEVISELRF